MSGQRLAAVLPPDITHAWIALSDLVPPEAYLGGGTAIALHLAHRTSHDLDFFLEAPVDLERLADTLARHGPLSVQTFDATPGRQTLNGVFATTKLQFLEASSLTVIEPMAVVEGIRVAGLGDLLAMKLKVIRGRGELRDYFDVLVIERDAHRRVEEGIALALAKYRPRGQDEFVSSIIRALAYLDDVPDDPGLPLGRTEIAAYWARRLPEVLQHLSRLS
ncbi:MAG: nucleotidyl transferase AbiEii/AbiGii toxin family protein [Actinomycetota bacterium]